MARPQSAAGKLAEEYLKQNPKATAEQVAWKSGLSISAVTKAPWWKNRAVSQKGGSVK